MPDPLYTLSYFSRSAINHRDIVDLTRELGSILQTARTSNAQREITGALLYTAGCFAQVLEGPLNEVESTFERIQLDPRHSDVKILQFHPLDRRSFADWSMAFGGIDSDTPERARIDAILADPGKIADGQEGLDFIAALRGLIARNAFEGA